MLLAQVVLEKIKAARFVRAAAEATEAACHNNDSIMRNAYKVITTMVIGFMELQPFGCNFLILGHLGGI